jgi:hypothetical protein
MAIIRRKEEQILGLARPERKLDMGATITLCSDCPQKPNEPLLFLSHFQKYCLFCQPKDDLATDLPFATQEKPCSWGIVRRM